MGSSAGWCRLMSIYCMSSRSEDWRAVSGKEGRDKDVVTHAFMEVVWKDRESAAGEDEINRRKNGVGMCDVGV